MSIYRTNKEDRFFAESCVNPEFGNEYSEDEMPFGDRTWCVSDDDYGAPIAYVDGENMARTMVQLLTDQLEECIHDDMIVWRLPGERF